ncbi:MAG: 50S ribosomal protein L19 [bacterium]
MAEETNNPTPVLEETPVVEETPVAQETPAEAPPAKKDYSKIRPGMTVAVEQKIEETTPKGDKRERIQTFEGIVLGISGKDNARTITVRKVASGVGVEKIFPLNMPSIADIRITKEAKVRRAWLGFLRKGKHVMKEKVAVKK